MGRPQPRAAATTTVRLLAAGGVTLLAAACGAPAASHTAPVTAATAASTRPRAAAPTRPAPTDHVHESFAAGAVDPSWEAAGATVTRGDGDPASWVHLVAAGTPAYVSPRPRALEQRRAGYRFTGRFRVTTRTPGRTVGLATVENARRTENADLFVDARTGRCRVDVFRADTALSPGRCDDGRWHTVTLTGDFGTATPTLAWTLDGERMPAVRSTGLAPTTVHRLWIGDATPGKTTTTDWTDLDLRLH